MLIFQKKMLSPKNSNIIHTMYQKVDTCDTILGTQVLKCTQDFRSLEHRVSHMNRYRIVMCHMFNLVIVDSTFHLYVPVEFFLAELESVSQHSVIM